MPLRIHKEQATIYTGSIDVKIIRLDKRQLTQAVFRQLDEELIFMADGSLRGVPWGRINYTWKDNQCGTRFHIIWQQENLLKRSPVPEASHIQLFDGEDARRTLEGHLSHSVDWFFDGEKPKQVLMDAMETNYHGWPSKGSTYYSYHVRKPYSAEWIGLVKSVEYLKKRVADMAKMDQLFIAT